MSRTPKFEEVLRGQLEQYRRNAETAWDFAIDPLESPIEKVFLAQMLLMHWRPGSSLTTPHWVAIEDQAQSYGLLGYPPDMERPHWADDALQHFLGPDDVTIGVTQPWMILGDRRIRPDFAFVLPHAEYGTKVIVELDGHDFHERTPEQAQSDKSRDRELQRLGWQVLRFTGREVLRDPDKCWMETMLALFGPRRAWQQRQGQS